MITRKASAFIFLLALVLSPGLLVYAQEGDWVNAVFRGYALGECVVIDGGDTYSGFGCISLRGVAEDLQPWFYPGGYTSEDMVAMGTLVVTWIDGADQRHHLSLALYTPVPAGGWVNEGGHFAVGNIAYSGIHRFGSSLMRVNGLFSGGPYSVSPPEPLDMVYVAHLKTSDNTPLLFLVWSRTGGLLSEGSVYNGAYNVVVPEDIYLRRSMVFGFEASAYD